VMVTQHINVSDLKFGDFLVKFQFALYPLEYLFLGVNINVSLNYD